MQSCANNESLHRYRAHVATLRHPVQRLISAFNYERPIAWVQKSYPKFSKCFDTFAEAFFAAASKLRDDSYQNDTNTDDDCPAIALRVLQGEVSEYISHFTYNYQYYEKVVLLPADDKHLLAIRQEHHAADLMSIHSILMGSVVTNTTTTSPTALDTSVRNVGLKVDLASIPPNVLQGACLVLCDEIQAYKRLLYRSENLAEQDLRESLQSLRETCPDEPIHHLRTDCTNR